MIDENRIQLGQFDFPSVDLENAKSIRPLSGRVAVQMVPTIDRRGSLWLPDEYQGNSRADVGIVVAVGESLNHRRPITVRPGDAVCVRGYDGTWINEPEFGRYKSDGQIRVYGTACQYQGEPYLTDWHDSIVCHIDRETRLPMRATGRNLIIRRNAPVVQERTIFLSSEAQYRECIAQVVSAGPECSDVKDGEWVHYNPTSLLEFSFSEDADLAVCTEDAINFVFTP